MDRIFHWLYFGLAALAAMWAIAYLSWPSSPDQGTFSWIGDVIHQGGMPYRDAWDIKGPLAYYLYALAQWLFGKNLWGIRLLDLAFLAASTAVLGRMVRDLADSVIARWACLIYILWYGSASFGSTAQPDGWASMMILIGMAPVIRSSGRFTLKSLVMAGFLVGCAALVKPFFAGFLLIPLLGMIVTEGTRARRLAADGIILVAACALPVTLALGWFAHRGALDELIEVHLIYPAVVYADVTSMSPTSIMKGVVKYVWEGKVVNVLWPVAVLGLLKLWQTARRTALLLLCWTSLGFLVAVLQNKFYDYHWSFLLPPLVLSGSVGFHALLEEWRAHGGESRSAPQPYGAALAFFFSLLLVFHVSVLPLRAVAKWIPFALGSLPAKDYYAGFPRPRAMHAADHIRGRTTENDRVAVLSWDTSVIYLSGRQSASRFGHTMPLGRGKGTAMRERYRREVLADLLAVRPVYIVVTPYQTGEIFGRGHPLADFPELESLIEDGYQSEWAFGGLTLFRLSEDQAHEKFDRPIGANAPGAVPPG